MATAAITGRRGRLRMRHPQSTPTANALLVFHEIRNWSLTPTQETIDASSCDSSGWNEYIPGQRGWIFRAETVFASQGNVTTVGVGLDIRNQMRLFFAANSNHRISYFELAMDKDALSTSASTGQKWTAGTTGNATTALNYVAAHVNNFRIGGTYDSLQLFELELQGIGTLTYSS